MDIQVSSNNPKVRRKIVELTAKVRDQISSKTTSCKVISTRYQRQLARKYRKRMSSCSSDCGVEFARLVKAEFVITGTLEANATQIMAVLEIHDAQKGNLITTKRVAGNNYFELEQALLSGVRRIVKPLNNIRLQATDDEVISDSSSDNNGNKGATTSGISGATSAPEYLSSDEEVEEEEEEITRLGERWKAAREQPALMEKDEDLRGLGLGVNVGYSLNVSRNRHLKDLYSPVIHIGVQAYYQVHPLIQIALVGDMDFLKGDYYADFGFDYVNDPDLQIISQTNEYDFKKYTTIGVRPTVRLTIPISLVEAFIGVGMGFNHVSTSGIWLKRRSGLQYYQDQGVVPDEVSESVQYYFTLSAFTFYAAFDLGVMARILDNRLGFGLLMQYKMPSMWRSGTDAKAKPNEYAMETQDPPFTTPSERDTIHSPIRHLDSLNLLTFGLLLDWRF